MVCPCRSPLAFVSLKTPFRTTNNLKSPTHLLLLGFFLCLSTPPSRVSLCPSTPKWLRCPGLLRVLRPFVPEVKCKFYSYRNEQSEEWFYDGEFISEWRGRRFRTSPLYYGLRPPASLPGLPPHTASLWSSPKVKQKVRLFATVGGTVDRGQDRGSVRLSKGRKYPLRLWTLVQRREGGRKRRESFSHMRILCWYVFPLHTPDCRPSPRNWRSLKKILLLLSLIYTSWFLK